MSNVVARVNGDEITETELNEMVAAYQKQYQKPEVSAEERKMLLENLVENKLLLAESKERNLEVSDDLLKRQLEVFFQQFGGEENFTAMLEAQGLSIDEVKNNVRVDLQGQLAAKDEVDKKISVSDEEIQAFYDTHKEKIKTEEAFRASHILFKNEAEDAKEKAEKVLADVKNDGDFAALAKEHSDCPSGANGGDLNVFGKGQMVPEFENAVVEMKVDDISDLVETQFGYHIIKKTGHIEGKNLSLDESKAQIKEIIYKEKSQVIVKELIDSLKEKFTVEYC